MLEVGWSIFDGGITRGKIKTTTSLENKALEKIKYFKLQIVEEIRIAVSAIKTAQAKILRSEKGISLSNEAYRIELLTYKNGKGTINDLLDAQSEVFSARAKLIQDKNDLIIANLSLRLAMGDIVQNEIF